MTHLTTLLLALVLACWSSAAARAEKRVALVIGNGAYAHTTPLANPANDARAMADALKSTGFHVIEAPDADRRGIDAALRGFTEQLADADVALFFYAGHGLQVGAQNYLVPIDAKLERERDLEFEAVRLDFVLRQMEIDRDGKTSIVFLDACRDNPLSRNLARSMGTRSAAIGRGLAATATGVGTFIAFATQPGNVALDGAGANSPFTAALSKHMRSTGRNLPATMIEVRKDVIAATSGKQVPWDHSALTGEFYFVPVAGAAAQPAPGATVAAPASSGTDLAALQERLRKLEADAQTRAPPSVVIGADGIRLAELRARAASLEDLNKDLQRRLFDARREEGKTTDPTEKAARLRRSIDIQMEWSRRGQDLQKLRQEIAVLEEGAKPVAADTPPPPKAKPGDAAATAGSDPYGPVTRSKMGFDYYTGTEVVVGDSIKDARVDSADGCMTVCRNTPDCAIAVHRPIGEATAGQKMSERTQFCAVYRAVSQTRANPEATLIKRGAGK